MVGGGGQTIIWSKHLMPRLTDRLIGHFPYEVRLTDRPASPADPESRDTPSGDMRVRADAPTGAD
ncbi:MAG TPA: hypothetical protein VIL85_16405 [Thermomicrobiales bacterium]